MNSLFLQRQFLCNVLTMARAQTLVLWNKFASGFTAGI
jgi:hypothetical protein